MKATEQGGQLREIDDCVISIPGADDIKFRILPEITDRKGAHYNDVPIIGRSVPIKTFSHGDNRVITMKAHFIVLEQQDIQNNMKSLRALQSLVYPQEPRDGNPYLPPPIARIKCGNLLTGEFDQFLCVVLKDYGVSYQTDVVWDETTLMPYKFDVDLTWEVVYPSENLPGHEKILKDIGA